MARPPKVIRKTCDACGIPFFTTPSALIKRRIHGNTYCFCSPECREKMPARASHQNDARMIRGFPDGEYDVESIDPWRLLAISILSLALDDYKRVLKHKKVIAFADSTKDISSKDGIEAFFQSDWAELLAMGSLSQSEMQSALSRIRATCGGAKT